MGCSGEPVRARTVLEHCDLRRHQRGPIPLVWKDSRQNGLKNENPAIWRGSLEFSSCWRRGLAWLLGRLLRLLPPLLGGLLTLLAGLVGLIALLRLAFIVLIHFISPRLLKNHLNAHHSKNDRTWRRIATNTKADARFSKIKFICD
jgi:hypothetical protein